MGHQLIEKQLVILGYGDPRLLLNETALDLQHKSPIVQRKKISTIFFVSNFSELLPRPAPPGTGCSLEATTLTKSTVFSLGDERLLMVFSPDLINKKA